MNTPALHTAALACLLVVAGCSGTPVADPSTVDEVATPAPVPTESLPEDRIAPGVSTDGIVDPERLADAHNEYLHERSYTRVSGTTYRFENGTVLARNTFNRSHAPATNRQLLERDSVGGPGPRTNYTEWANGTVAVERIERDGAVRYTWRERPDERYRHHGGGIATFIAEQDPTVVGKRQANGTTEYVLVSRNATGLRLLEQVEATRETTPRLVAVVTREGLVRSAQVTVRGRYHGTPVRVRLHYAITDVGETTVARPPWLDEARDATSAPQNATTATRTAG